MFWMKLLSSITLALIGLSYGQVDYSDYSADSLASDYSYELDQLDSVLADLEANPTVEPFEPVIGARARGGGAGGSGRGIPGANAPSINLPPALQAFTLPSSSAGSRKLPPGIDLADFIGPNGFQTQRFLKALQAALRRQAEEQRRRQQAAREAAEAEAARQAAAEKAAAEQAAAEAAARKAAEEEAARKAAAIEAAKVAAAEAARQAAEEAAALEAARQQAAAEAAAAARLAAEQAAEAERQRLVEEQAMMEAMQAESMMFGGFDSTGFGNMDGMVASATTGQRPSGGRPSSGRPSSGSASAGTRDFIGSNAGNAETQEVFNSCRVCTKMTAAECAVQSLVTCYDDKSKEGVFGFTDPSMEQDDRVCMLQTEQRKLTNGQIKTLFTSRCVTPMACETQLRQNFQSTTVEGLMTYNRCKQTGMLRKNGNTNKSECAFCNKMSHVDPVTHRDHQWFPTDNAGVQQDCSADEPNCVVFRYKNGGVYTDMKMSDLFPSTVTIGTPSAFLPHTWGLWTAGQRLGRLEAEAGYIVE